jgi:hypothetical protein
MLNRHMMVKKSLKMRNNMHDFANEPVFLLN